MSFDETCWDHSRPDLASVPRPQNCTVTSPKGSKVAVIWDHTWLGLGLEGLFLSCPFKRSCLLAKKTPVLSLGTSQWKFNPFALDLHIKLLQCCQSTMETFFFKHLFQHDIYTFSICIFLQNFLHINERFWINLISPSL